MIMLHIVTEHTMGKPEFPDIRLLCI